MPSEPQRRAWVIAPQVGVDSQVWLWRQILGLRRHRPTVITGEWRNRDTFPLSGIPYHEVPAIRRSEVVWRRWLGRARRVAHQNFLAIGEVDLRKILTIAEAEPPDVILAQFGHTALRMLPVAESLGVPLIAHFHGLDLSSSLRNRWYRWSLRRHAGRFAGAVVVGSHQVDRVIDVGVRPDRVRLIPCGVPTTELPYRQHEPEGPIRFLTVGRLEAWKGIHVAIEALRILRSEGVVAFMDIVGDGSQLEVLRAQSDAAGLSDRITFWGSRTPDQVRSHLRASHVLLQPSLTLNGWDEGFGISVTEAAATGLPVVVSRSGGLVDQVDDGVTGFLCPEGDARAFADRMNRLCDDASLRQRLGLAARRQAEQKFDTARLIAQLEDFLDTTAE